jgi:hypothetical protein
MTRCSSKTSLSNASLSNRQSLPPPPIVPMLQLLSCVNIHERVKVGIPLLMDSQLMSQRRKKAKGSVIYTTIRLLQTMSESF